MRFSSLIPSFRPREWKEAQPEEAARGCRGVFSGDLYFMASHGAAERFAAELKRHKSGAAEVATIRLDSDFSNILERMFDSPTDADPEERAARIVAEEELEESKW